MKGVNFLPFMRRETFEVPATAIPPSRIYTNISNFATGGMIRAHLQDLIIFQGSDTSGGGSEATDGKLIRMRMAITGQNYMTEQLYDYKVYRDGLRPLNSVWKWNRPYRIYPGEGMEVTIGQGPNAGEETPPDVRSIMFNGVRVDDGSPIMLYAQRTVDATDTGMWRLDSRRLMCPSESAVDLYSVTTAEFGFDAVDSTPIMIVGPDDRPWWNNRAWEHMIDPPVASIMLGKGWTLQPGETLALEFENEDTKEDLVVILRGVLEVADSRCM